MDCRQPDSSVHGISQARVLEQDWTNKDFFTLGKKKKKRGKEWIASSFFRRSSQPRGQIHISYLAGRFFTTEPPGKPTCCGYCWVLIVYSLVSSQHLVITYPLRNIIFYMEVILENCLVYCQLWHTDTATQIPFKEFVRVWNHLSFSENSSCLLWYYAIHIPVFKQWIPNKPL